MRSLLFILVCVGFVACGSESNDFGRNVPTGAPPTVNSINPANASGGEVVTVRGFGFSMIAAENIIIFGEEAISAESYELLDNPTSDEIEALTFTVPADSELGEQALLVLVGDNTSNNSVSLTVEP